MAIGILIATVSILVTAFILWQQFQQRDRTRGPSRLRALRSGSNVFRSVSIDAGDNCCAAASALRGQRLLLSEAPRLPLADCDRADCTCSFIYFADRRDSAADRRSGEREDANGVITRLHEQRQQERRDTHQQDSGD